MGREGEALATGTPTLSPSHPHTPSHTLGFLNPVRPISHVALPCHPAPAPSAATSGIKIASSGKEAMLMDENSSSSRLLLLLSNQDFLAEKAGGSERQEEP